MFFAEDQFRVYFELDKLVTSINDEVCPGARDQDRGEAGPRGDGQDPRDPVSSAADQVRWDTRKFSSESL